MIGALWNGISGMNSYTNALTAESNNVANINTVGYKEDTVSFADMAYTDGVGKGAHASSITKSFAQGNLKVTGGDYDLAISGKGFFTAFDVNNQELRYTRAGNFRVGNDGTLQMPNGFEVYGIPMTKLTAADVVGTTGGPTKFTTEHSQTLASQSIVSDSMVKTINAKATDYKISATADDLATTSGSGYKSKDTKIEDAVVATLAYTQALSLYSSSPIAGTAPAAQEDTVSYASFATDLTKQGDYIEVVINGDTVRQSFDTDAQTTMNLFADKISKSKGGIEGTVDAAGLLTIKSLIPGKGFDISSPKINTTAFAITNGTVNVTGTGMANVTATRTALQTAIENADGKFLDITNTVDTSTVINSSQVINGVSYDSKVYTQELTSLQTKLNDLGISDNQFGAAEIDNGIIYLRQGENKFVIGKVTVHAFSDDKSLIPEGDNVYSKTINEDTPNDVPIAMEGITSVLSGTLELSNSQLSTGLVNLMVYQRAFEANSKLFAAADDFLNIAIQLKK